MQTIILFNISNDSKLSSEKPNPNVFVKQHFQLFSTSKDQTDQFLSFIIHAFDPCNTAIYNFLPECVSFGQGDLCDVFRQTNLPLIFEHQYNLV